MLLPWSPQDVEEKIENVLCFVGGGWMVDQPDPNVSIHVHILHAQPCAM